MPATARKEKTKATTVRLPTPIYDAATHVVESGDADVDSLNELIVDSLSQRLEALREQAIDAAFAEMANDPDYQRQAVAIAREFERSDWDAIKTGRSTTTEDAETAPQASKASSR